MRKYYTSFTKVTHFKVNFNSKRWHFTIKVFISGKRTSFKPYQNYLGKPWSCRNQSLLFSNRIVL